MVYITGDPHSDFTDIYHFCMSKHTHENDIMIVLGDVGLNYFLNEYDDENKKRVSGLPITFLFLRGNHEERPENIPSYTLKHIKDPRFEAMCYVEEKYPNLYFLKDGVMTLDGKTALVINGAYSVDKWYRLTYGYNWFKDEELTDEEMKEIYEHAPGKVDYIFSHTCPEKYEPKEAYLPGINRNAVSKRMEEFLDTIEEKVSYGEWYCGHWHINKKKGKMNFLFHDVEVLL